MNDLRIDPWTSSQLHSLQPNSLQSGAAQPVASTPLSPKLVGAAHDFEASMMKELLAPLQPGEDSLSGGDDSEGSSSALAAFASEALGKAISEHGGLGIASSILHQLSSRSTHSGRASVPSTGPVTTTKTSFQ
jgi:Rod binding domain-containing protein